MSQWVEPQPKRRHANWMRPTALALLSLLAASTASACAFLWVQTQELSAQLSALEHDLSANERAVSQLETAADQELNDETLVGALTAIDERLTAVEDGLGSSLEFESVNDRVADLQAQLAALDGRVGSLELNSVDAFEMTSLTNSVNGLERDVDSLCTTLLLNTDLFISC